MLLTVLSVAACGKIGSADIDPIKAVVYSISGPPSVPGVNAPPKPCPEDVNLPCTRGTYGDLSFAPDSTSVFVTFAKTGDRSVAVRVDLDEYKQMLVPPPFCGISVNLIDVSRTGLMAFGVSRPYTGTLPSSDPKFRPSGVAIVPHPGASPWAFETNRKVSHMAMSGNGQVLFIVLAHPTVIGDHVIQGFDLVNGTPIHAITRKPSDIMINEFMLRGMSFIHRVWADEAGSRLLLLAQTNYVGEAMFDLVRKSNVAQPVPLSVHRFLFEIDMRDGAVSLHDLNAALALEPDWGTKGAGLSDFQVAASGDTLFTLMRDNSASGEVAVRRYRADRIDSFANVALPMADSAPGWLRRFAVSPDGRWLAFQYKAPSDGVADDVFAVFDRSSGALRPVDADRVPRDPQLAKAVCPSS